MRFISSRTNTCELTDQVLVANRLLHAVIVQFLADRLTLVVEIVEVTRLLMVNFEYGPQSFDLALAFVWSQFGFTHFTFELVERRFDEIPGMERRVRRAHRPVVTLTIRRVAVSCLCVL